MENINLNTIKKIAVQKAEAKCDQLIKNYIQGGTKDSIDMVKQKLNEILITECIRFSENLISNQYDHIAQKVKDAISMEFGQQLTNIKQDKIQRLDQPV